MLQVVGGGGLVTETSIEVPPYGTYFIVVWSLPARFGTVYGLSVHYDFFLWIIRSMLYEVFRPGSMKSSICRSVVVRVFIGVVGVVVCLNDIFGGHSPNFI